MKSLPISESLSQSREEITMGKEREHQSEHLLKSILLHNILESVKRRREISTKPFTSQNLDDIKKTLAFLKKHQPILVSLLVLANFFVLLTTLLADSYKLLGVGISLFTLLITYFIMMHQKLKIKNLELDIEDKKKIVGTFKIIGKEVFRSQKSMDRHILIFDLPKAREIEVLFDLWYDVKQNDICYLERSFHHGFVLKLVHNGVDVQHQVIQ